MTERYVITGSGGQHGTVSLLVGERDGTSVLIAAEPRMAADILDAVDAGESVECEIEPWQIVGGVG